MPVDLGDGPDPSSHYSLAPSRKIKDYFTGCTPWPQKGTASFINDVGNLGVTTTTTTTASPSYPFGHTFKFINDEGEKGYFISSGQGQDMALQEY